MVINLQKTADTCLSEGDREMTIQNISANVQNTLLPLLSNIIIGLYCGPREWYQVASLNTSDPSQLCPSVWREFNSSGARACRRPATSIGSCPATYYATNLQYSRVCGRVIGYQYGSPDALIWLENNSTY